MILVSAFNWNLDLDLPRYGIIFRSEYIFNLILMNLCFISAYLNRNKSVTKYTPWILTLLFCLYAFWDQDYFNFAENFYDGLKDFRDYLYLPLSYISLGSYVIFRLFIWGIALILYYNTSKRFNLNKNISIFVFNLFFLLTFSYARVSLGMASYFYGLSFILISKKESLIFRLICAICLFTFALMAHRSMVFLIILTPLCFIRVSKFTIVVSLILIPIIVYSLNLIIGIVTAGALSSESGVSNAATQYASYVSEQEMNWKYKLITNIHYIGFYCGLFSVLYKTYFSKTKYVVPKDITQLVPLIIILQIISFCLINSTAFGLWIIGYRFLYMTGIPLCLIIIWMDQNHIFNKKWLRIIFMWPVLYSEGFIIGKILSGG